MRTNLTCIDELAALATIFGKKIDLLTGVEEDCARFEKEDESKDLQVSNIQGETAQQRVKFALRLCKETREHTQRLIADLTESVNTVSQASIFPWISSNPMLRWQLFQLRSIEQNELAIAADSQNKAIFIFTGVTIVFLPLSFFSSYFGMNLDGVVDTPRIETCFWKLCGSLSVVIIGLTAALVFRRQIWITFMSMNPRDRRLGLSRF